MIPNDKEKRMKFFGILATVDDGMRLPSGVDPRRAAIERIRELIDADTLNLDVFEITEGEYLDTDTGWQDPYLGEGGSRGDPG